MLLRLPLDKLPQGLCLPRTTKDTHGHQKMVPVWPQAMIFRKLSPPWSHLTVYNWHPSHPWVLLGDTLRLTGTSEASRPLIQPYLRHVDTAFQKGAVSCIVGANVAVFAPMAGEGAVDTCQAAAGGNGTVRPREFQLVLPPRGPSLLLLLEVSSPQGLCNGCPWLRRSPDLLACCTGLIENGLTSSDSSSSTKYWSLQ